MRFLFIFLTLIFSSPAFAEISFKIGKRKFHFDTVPSQIISFDDNFNSLDDSRTWLSFRNSNPKRLETLRLSFNNLDLKEGAVYDLVDRSSDNYFDNTIIPSISIIKIIKKSKITLTQSSLAFTKGKLKIKKIDEEKKIISGKFYFKFIASKKDSRKPLSSKKISIKVKNGKFRIDYNDNKNISYFRD